MKPERTTGAESARKALSILMMFSEKKTEVTVEDIIEDSGLSQTSAYRYLSLLRELGLIQLRSSGTYVLTRKILQIAAAVEEVIDLDRLSGPTLRALSEFTHETAFMLRRARNQACFVASHQPDRSLVLSFRPGSLLPLHRGAAAKVLLAFGPMKFQKKYLERFIDDPDEKARLENELDEIRAIGYAESLAEVDEGIWGGAVPVHFEDRVIASLSVAGPSFRITTEQRIGIIEQLKVSAGQLTLDLQAEEATQD